MEVSYALQNHSCKPNLDVMMVRLGSHPRAFVLPLVVGDVKKGIPAGVELTISYWHVHLVPAVRICYIVRV